MSGDLWPDREELRRRLAQKRLRMEQDFRLWETELADGDEVGFVVIDTFLPLEDEEEEA